MGINLGDQISIKIGYIENNLKNFYKVIKIKKDFTRLLTFKLFRKYKSQLFFIGFIMDVYYAYGTKSMPAFSPFIITFQIKFTLIFVFLLLGLDTFVDSFNNYFISKFEY